MSLITCCPSCGTKFRVVADQLRISDGWVRCGRCQEVFDAAQALETVAPAAAPATAPAPNAQPASQAVASQALQGTQVAASQGASPALADQVLEADALDTMAQPSTAPVGTAKDVQRVPASELDAAQVHAGYVLPAPEVAVSDSWLDGVHEPLDPLEPESPFAGTAALPVGDGRTDPIDDLAPQLEFPVWAPQAALNAENAQAMQWSSVEPSPQVQPVASPDSPQLHALPDDAVAADADNRPATELDTGAAADAGAATLSNEAWQAPAHEVEGEVPSFVRQAQRKAWWNRPMVRFAMGMLVIFLPFALLLQIALHERNTVVAWKPQWRGVFEVMCVTLQCELQPRKHIASMVISGSSFNQGDRPYHYELGLSLQNLATTAVATPAVELTLTDSQNQIVVRKVLPPQALGAPEEIAARAEWSGQFEVVTEGLDLPVAGYRVMVFYP